MARPKYTLKFYDAPDGTVPVLDWLRSLPPSQKRAVGQAMNKVLQRDGIDVCGTEFGKQIGKGLFEFRVRLSSEDALARGAADSDAWEMVVRVLCFAHGRQLILLLGGYDKAKDPSRKRQQGEVATARKRLAEWRRRKGAAGS